MKKLEVTVTLEESFKVVEIFEEMGLTDTLSNITIENKESKVYYALIPNELIDDVIDKISKSLDLRLKENMITVVNVEGFVSSHLERLKKKAIEAKPPSNPLERLVESTSKYTRTNVSMLTMALFATIIALAGLFLDKIIIVIGAMLLSPLMGPINAFAVNASLGRIKTAISSQFSLLTLVTSTILLSALITFIASQFFQLPMTQQILERSTASTADIAIALILGFAGGLALFIGAPEILVGVAVAVALLPPAAVSGIGLALSDLNLFLGSFVLTIVNLLGLELGSTLMLKIKGVSPRIYYQKAKSRKQSVYSIIILILLLIVIGVIITAINN